MKKHQATSGIKSILVPTDFSSYSSNAIDYAAKMAKPLGARIVLAHVIESLSYSVTDTFTLVDHRRALEKTAGALLENSCQQLAAKGLSVKTRLANGVPYEEILKISRRENADLIVMGTHGRTGMEHLFLGSVAEKVVRLSTCPVLTIPARSRRRLAAKSTGRSAVTLY
jgi:universal stress protein A